MFSLLFLIPLYVLLRVQGHLPLNPDHLPSVNAGVAVEHRLELRHEHELAVLRRRVHHELPEPDGRPGGAELHLGRRRHGRAGRDDPRLRPPRDVQARQLLGRPLPHDRLHPAADLHRHGGLLHLAGRARHVQRPRGRAHRPGPHAEHRPRAGGVADRDQAAGHQRRRLLQLELGRAVREPERVHELRRDAVHPASSARPRCSCSARWCGRPGRGGDPRRSCSS